MSTLKVDGIRSNSASSDAITLASDGTCTSNITNNLSNRNLIINGAMQVAQRGTSFATASEEYTLDRFYYYKNLSTGVVTISQEAVTDLAGFTKALKINTTTAETGIPTASGNKYAGLYQNIEAQNLQHIANGTSGAKSLTLSFWVKSNVQGTFCVTLYKPDNTQRIISLAYTINSQNTWEKKELTFAGDTAGGGINNDPNNGLGVYFILARQTDFSGTTSTSWINYANAGWANLCTGSIFENVNDHIFITGVQLEVGSVATDFEHKLFAQELALCQRYFYGHSGGATPVNGSNSSTPDSVIGLCSCLSTSGISFNAVLPVPMRAVPSIYSTVTGSDRYRVNSAGANVNSGSDPVIYTAGSTHTNVNFDLGGFSGLQSGQAGNVRRFTGTGVLGLSAEL